MQTKDHDQYVVSEENPVDNRNPSLPVPFAHLNDLSFPVALIKMKMHVVRLNNMLGVECL